MRLTYKAGTLLFLLICGMLSIAQQTQSTNSNVVVPPLVRFSGTLNDATGKPLTGVVGVTFALYKEEQGGAPLWLETQNVTADKSGHYAIMLGSTTSTGLPADIFVAGEARWLAVQPQGQEEQSRVLLLSVPYALKAGDAQTLGGLPASAFVQAAPGAVGMNSATSAAVVLPWDSSRATSDVTTTGGTVDTLPLFTAASNVQNSIVTQTGSGATGKIGVNTTAPATALDVNGAVTVRGALGSVSTGTATAASGFNSQPQDFVASVFNSSTATPVGQKFQWQAEAVNNDTSAASGTMNLLYASGTATPAETGLHINSKGQITFAADQTFPGTGAGTITGVTAGTDLVGGGTSGDITLSLNTAATNALYAQLGASNTYTGPQTIKNTTIMTGTNPAGVLQATNTATSGTTVGVSGVSASTAGFGVEGQSPNVGVLGNGTGTSGIGVDGHGTFQGVKGISTATTGAAQGVYGQSASIAGYGVEGTSPFVGVFGTGKTAGVNGNTSTAGGYGVLGSTTSSLGAGVFGSSSNSDSYGVYGQVTAVSGTSAGVFGGNASPGSGYGVQGSGGLIGVFGTAAGTTSFGVEGSSPNVGVFGDGTGSGGIGVDGHGTIMGVRAIATETTGASVGAYGQSSSTTGFGVKGAGPNVGVYGTSSGTSKTGSGDGSAGVWGDTGGKTGDGFYGVLGTADSNSAGGFFNNSETFPALYAVDNAPFEGLLGAPNPPVIESYAPSFAALCAFYALGDQECSGTSTTSTAVENGTRRVSLYSVQSPNVWFEDAGSGQLSNGSTTVTLDPTFAQAANTGVEYHVFLTPNGDCKGLYVSRKTAATFEVHELGGGTSSIAFDYRIMAKRAGYENKRMEDVTERYRMAAKLAQARGVQRRSTAAANAPVHNEAPPVAFAHK